MSSKPIKERDFPKFKMGFKRARSRDFKAHIPNFSEIVDKGELTAEELEGTSKLVSTFLKTFARTTNIDRFGKAG